MPRPRRSLAGGLLEPAAYLSCIGMRPGGVTRYALAAGPGRQLPHLESRKQSKSCSQSATEKRGQRGPGCTGARSINPALTRVAPSPSTKNHTLHPNSKPRNNDPLQTELDLRSTARGTHPKQPRSEGVSELQVCVQTRGLLACGLFLVLYLVWNFLKAEWGSSRGGLCMSHLQIRTHLLLPLQVETIELSRSALANTSYSILDQKGVAGEAGRGIQIVFCL